MNYEAMRKARDKKEMTQIEVARLVGVSINTYRNWEQGGSNPTEENLQKLKEVLGVKGRE